jgi:hypothetical protein
LAFNLSWRERYSLQVRGGLSTTIFSKWMAFSKGRRRLEDWP